MVVLFSLSYCCSRQEIDQTYFFFFFNDTATTEIYTLSLHDALPIFFARQPVVLAPGRHVGERGGGPRRRRSLAERSEEHTSELQSLAYIVCRLLLQKTKSGFAESSSVLQVRTCTLVTGQSTVAFLPH